MKKLPKSDPRTPSADTTKRAIATSGAAASPDVGLVPIAPPDGAESSDDETANHFAAFLLQLRKKLF
jgi:hypothetical protein